MPVKSIKYLYNDQKHFWNTERIFIWRGLNRLFAITLIEGKTIIPLFWCCIFFGAIVLSKHPIGDKQTQIDVSEQYDESEYFNRYLTFDENRFLQLISDPN